MASRKTQSKSSSSKGTGKKSGKQQPRNGRQSVSARSSSRRSAAPEPAAPTRNMKRDIIGVAIACVAVALFITVITNPSAPVARVTSEILRYGLGIGAYILPLALFAWAITFFMPPKHGNMWRIVLGGVMFIVALLATLACYTEGADTDLSMLFANDALVSRGGYVGAGLAWCFMSIVGRAISTVIFIGLMIIGCVIVGLSISRILEMSREKAAAAHEARMAMRSALHGEDEMELPERGRGSGRNRSGGDMQGQAAHSRSRRQLDEERTRSLDADETALLGYDEELEPAKTKVKGRKDSSAKTELLDKPTEAATQVIPAKSVFEPDPDYVLPPAKLLNTTPAAELRKHNKDVNADLSDIAAHLEATLESFNLYARVVGWVAGPTVTMFKIEMPTGVKLQKITGLENDIALALAAESVRIFAPIPGTSLVGIEIPNRNRANVLLGDILPTVAGGPLMLAIGRDVDGESVSEDLDKMPHLLIGGTTGSGKSVAINSFIMSMLMRATPDEVRMILIDPKRVEMAPYNGIPHLFVPVVTDPRQAAATLAWATIEMDRRLKVFEKAGARNIGAYDNMIAKGMLDDEYEHMPYMVIVIDELADLMMVAGKEVEGSIVRIAQLGRAAGIHLIVATQRPSANVVTGLIKANIVYRIAFKVATKVDSRVILDQSGADKLVGHGDLLFLRGDGGEPKRIQGCFVGDAEINEVVAHLKEQGEPEYHNDILTTNAGGVGSVMDIGGGSDGGDDDPLLWEAAEIVVSSQMGSTSNIQRRLKVGYARAGRIMDQLEDKGVVGPANGSKPREVMVGDVTELDSLRAIDAYDDSEAGDY